MSETLNGGCLCGGVRYRLSGPIPDGTGCHCTQCRRMTGHFLASTTIDNGQFSLVKDETLAWYKASDIARRGFCKQCGSTLFWDPVAEDRISVALGSVDGDTGIRMEEHIFTDTAGDYYTLPEG